MHAQEDGQGLCYFFFLVDFASRLASSSTVVAESMLVLCLGISIIDGWGVKGLHTHL